MLLPADAAVAARDPALPGLATLLDEEALLAQTARLPGPPTERVEVVALRYRPGAAALASLRLRQGAQTRLASAHAWADEAPDLRRAGPGSLVLPELQLAISPLVEDLRLSNLPSALDAGARARLFEVLGLPLPTRHEELQILSYRPQRRLALRCGSEGAVVLKLYRGGGYRRALLRQRWRVRATGLAAPTFLAAAEGPRCLALAWHPGRPFALRLRSGEAARGLEAVAEECARRLAELHGRAAPELPELEDADLDAWLETQLRSLAQLDPALLPEARAALGPELHASATAPVTLHGDFHAKQVLSGDAGVLLLDLDDACRGEPERDLACFSAHLKRDAALGRIDAGVADAIDARFQGAYAATHPHVSTERMRGLTRRLLVGMASYPFRVRLPEWRAHAAAIVAAARALGAG